MVKLSVQEEEVMNVLWEEEEDLYLSQLIRRVEERYLHGRDEEQVKTIIGNMVQKGVAESYRSGQEEKYRAKLSRKDCRVTPFSGMGGKVFKDAVYEGAAALTAADELTGEEYEKLQRMIDELDDSR